MSNKNVLIQARFILANLNVKEKLVQSAYEIKDYLIDLVLEGLLSEVDFYKITSVTNPTVQKPSLGKIFYPKAQLSFRKSQR